MKYLDTKENSLENSVLRVWQEAAKKQEDLDPVDKNAKIRTLIMMVM